MSNTRVVRSITMHSYPYRGIAILLVTIFLLYFLFAVNRLTVVGR